MRTRLAFVLLLAIVAGACATSSGGSGEPRRDRNRLTAEDLVPVEGFTAWDAVQRLRPMWLRPGGIRNSANPAGHYPAVFVDQSPFGDLDALNRFRVANIEEIRYMNATDATIRYGGAFQGGVILITMKRQE